MPEHAKSGNDVEIIVSHDGVWPRMWHWRASVLIEHIGAPHHMSGYAITEKRAWKNARRACKSITFERQQGNSFQRLRRVA